MIMSFFLIAYINEEENYEIGFLKQMSVLYMFWISFAL